MNAYYNENDPFAVAWLRELIKAKLIADGEVDDRSIEQVEPDDLRGFTQCHFFAGIGVWSYALRNAGWSDDSPVWTGSCPCQSFSAAGKGEGFSDKRHLWPAWFRLISECQPYTIFGEQVASKDGLAWLDVVSADLEGTDYAIGTADLCAAGFGAPHIRQRLFFVADSVRGRCEQWDASKRAISILDTFGANESLAYPNIVISGNGELQRSGRLRRVAEDAPSCELADSERSRERRDARTMAGEESNTEKRQPKSRRSPVHAEYGCTASLVADAGNAERRQSSIGRDDNHATETGRDESTGSDRERGTISVMAYSEREQLRTGGSRSLTKAAAEVQGLDGQRERLRHDAEKRSPTNGFWRDAEWLYCRDGKYRPTKPGTPVLATGIANRVGKLRGFGNAINAEVAQGFIEAYLEATG